MQRCKRCVQEKRIPANAVVEGQRSLGTGNRDALQGCWQSSEEPAAHDIGFEIHINHHGWLDTADAIDDVSLETSLQVVGMRRADQDGSLAYGVGQ